MAVAALLIPSSLNTMTLSLFLRWESGGEENEEREGGREGGRETVSRSRTSTGQGDLSYL